MKNGSNENILLAVSKISTGVTSTSKLLPVLLQLKLIYIVLLLLSFSNVLFSQGYNFSVSIKGNYTSSTRYYPSSIPNSSSVYTYENYETVNNLFGYGLELRYDYSEHIKIGLSVERISDFANYDHRTLKIPVKSNFNMYIMEANGYYNIPLSGERFKFYIGGGLNIAKCNSYDEISTIKSVLLNSPLNIGIQALSGFEYFLNKDFSARWEIKFRDPIVENESRYNTSRIYYNDRYYTVSTKPYKSKVNIDGLVLDLSFAYHFF
jgi:hypothetical protein